MTSLKVNVSILNLILPARPSSEQGLFFCTLRYVVLRSSTLSASLSLCKSIITDARCPIILQYLGSPSSLVCAIVTIPTLSSAANLDKRIERSESNSSLVDSDLPATTSCIGSKNTNLQPQA